MKVYSKKIFVCILLPLLLILKGSGETYLHATVRDFGLPMGIIKNLIFVKTWDLLWVILGEILLNYLAMDMRIKSSEGKRDKKNVPVPD